MAGLSPFYSPTSQQVVPNPSPLARSIASSVGFGYQPASLNTFNLILRSFVFILSAVAALSLAAPMPDKGREWKQRSFQQVPEFKYDGLDQPIWLHCVKYSGPGWEYECPHPAWAIL